MGKSSSDVSSEEDLCKTSAIMAWLHFLQMDQYYQEFIDNGYDDLETAKKIGLEDLDAIGVEDQHHKIFLLDAVRVLREQGAAWVYLLESSQTLTDSGLGDPGDRASAGSSGIASLPWTDHDASSSGDNSTCSSSKFHNNIKISTNNKTKCLVELTPEHSARNNLSQHSSPRIHSTGSTNGMIIPNTTTISGIRRHLLMPEEEDLIQSVSELHNNHNNSGKMSNTNIISSTTGTGNTSAAGTTFLNSGSGYSSNNSSSSFSNKKNCDQDFLQLCNLVKDKLNREGISLAAPPFTTKAGDGYLAGLAARFASELHFEEDDVLHQLEDLRSAATSEWPSIRSVVNPAASNNQRRMSETESHNYANYPGNLEDKSFLPGIYASSSCLSDKDEDDIYDFAAKYEGGKQILRNGNMLKISQGMCKFAKKAMTLRRNEQPQPSGASMASFSSGSASAFNSPLPSHNGFSTRTRLRPGGPSNSPSSSNNFQDNPQLLFLHTTTRNTNKIGGNFQNNGSLPSFEEIGMKTLAHPTSSTSHSTSSQQYSHHHHQNSQFLLNRRPYFSTIKPSNNSGLLPSTPLVKQKTSGCASPRVQMYRTRVVYSDARDAVNIKAQEAAV